MSDNILRIEYRNIWLWFGSVVSVNIGLIISWIYVLSNLIQKKEESFILLFEILSISTFIVFIITYCYLAFIIRVIIINSSVKHSNFKTINAILSNGKDANCIDLLQSVIINHKAIEYAHVLNSQKMLRYINVQKLTERSSLLISSAKESYNKSYDAIYLMDKVILCVYFRPLPKYMIIAMDDIEQIEHQRNSNIITIHYLSGKNRIKSMNIETDEPDIWDKAIHEGYSKSVNSDTCC